MQLWLDTDIQKHTSTEKLEELQPKGRGSRISHVLVKSRLKNISSVDFLIADRKVTNTRSLGERIVVWYLF